MTDKREKEAASEVALRNAIIELIEWFGYSADDVRVIVESALEQKR